MLSFLLYFVLFFISLGLLFLFSTSLFHSNLFFFALLGLFSFSTIIKFVYIHVRVLMLKSFFFVAFLYSLVGVWIPWIYSSSMMVYPVNFIRVYSSSVLIVIVGFNSLLIEYGSSMLVHSVMLLRIYSSSMMVHAVNLLGVYGSSMLIVSVRVGLVLAVMLCLMVLLGVHPLLMMLW